ncbi:MAG: ABC transporter permease [Phycisphaerales bacterium]|nr:ABC transporter permease [Phycisphaerales bacterium]
MRQTLALFLDAYRELNAKKLFWITMFISLIVVAVYAMFGLNDRGLTFLWWTFDLPLLNTKTIPADKLYKFMFANIGIPIWLTWAATILALISTASIIPDFIAGGAIELTLSKPIGRARLFLTKFITGLLFVGLQVAVFTTACFLVIGIRGGSWEFRLFLAIPIVLVFFSYLFSVCAVLGLATRSTIASLLITILVWLVFWGVNTTDGIFILQRERTRLNLERTTRTVERGETLARRQIEKARADGTPVPGIDTPLPAGAADELEAFNALLHGARADRAKAAQSAATWQRWSGYMYAAKTVLPKTDETIRLLNRYLLTAEDLALFNPDGRRRDRDNADERADFGDPEVARRAELAVRDRSVLWVLGTSLLFEAFVLALGTIMFVRRDF